MVSIIICSISNSRFQTLSNSIKSTIGEIPYEVIKIENQILNLDIAKAYNKGLEKAKFEFALFVHEDIIFHTYNWGNILFNYFVNNPAIGLIGIAGSKMITKIPSAWWENNAAYLVLNIIQHHPTGIIKNLNQGFCSGEAEEVVVIDGVFIAMKVDERIKFNEKIKGFHNYDQSISLDYRRLGYKVMVLNNILIEHCSSGNKNSEWILSTINFFKQYNSQLPQYIAPDTIDNRQINILYLKFINSCKKVGNNEMAFRYWLKYFIRNPFKRKNLKEFIYFLKQFFF